jgi:hypothetical protein
MLSCVARFALITALSAVGAFAQSTGATSGTISGTVIDSVHTRELDGAYVELVPSGRQAVTNASGRFHFDSVAPGSGYRLRVMHALLDTLGVSVATPPITVVAGQTLEVEVATPSAARLIELLCPASMRARGPSALVGFVRDPDTGAALDSVSISLVFDESPVSSIRWASNRVAKTNANGHFAVCGLPNRVDGLVQATRGSHQTPDVPVVIGAESPLALRALGISLNAERVAGDADSAGRRVTLLRGKAMLAGRVVAKTGEPIAGAYVQMDRTVATGVTNASGQFTLFDVPSGTQVVRVRKIGLSVVSQAVDVSSSDSPPVRIAMRESVPTLPTVVTVSDRNSDLERTGFARRKAHGLGFFLEGEQIDHGPPSLGESLRMVPGLHIGYNAQNQRKQTTVTMSSRDPSRGCVRYILDGVYYQEIGGDIEKLVRPADVEALEMYNPSAVPGEFADAGRGKCSVLVLWTNHMIRPAKP